MVTSITLPYEHFFDSIPPSFPWAYREVVIFKEKKNKMEKKQTTQPFGSPGSFPNLSIYWITKNFLEAEFSGPCGLIDLDA